MDPIAQRGIVFALFKVHAKKQGMPAEGVQEADFEKWYDRSRDSVQAALSADDRSGAALHALRFVSLAKVSALRMTQDLWADILGALSGMDKEAQFVCEPGQCVKETISAELVENFELTSLGTRWLKEGPPRDDLDFGELRPGKLKTLLMDIHSGQIQRKAEVTQRFKKSVAWFRGKVRDLKVEKAQKTRFIELLGSLK